MIGRQDERGRGPEAAGHGAAAGDWEVRQVAEVINMKPKVYVETSVIGYLTSWPSGDLIVAARQKITHDWWRDAPAKYELMASDVVLREASTGDPQAVQDRLAVLMGLPVLPPAQEAQDLANA